MYHIHTQYLQGFVPGALRTRQKVDGSYWGLKIVPPILMPIYLSHG